MTRSILGLIENYNIVALVAGPGTGKTVQAQLCARALSTPLAWLTVDRSHPSAARLIFDLGQALRVVAPNSVELVRRIHQSDGTADEAAATLAASCAGSHCLLVIDDCHNLVDQTEPWLALDTFLDYLPDEMQVLMLSRTDLQWPLDKRYIHGQVGYVPADTLNLTLQESAELLAHAGGEPRHAAEVYEATGGWMAGVAFAARFGLPAGTGSHNLSRYLDNQILDQLPADELEFLLDTSIVDVVTPEIAVALHGPAALGLWSSVTTRSLPALTVADQTITYHSLLRNALRDRLLKQRPGAHDELSLCYAKHLIVTRRFEEASEVLMALGRLDEALEPAKLALPSLYDRADWALVLRWLNAFGELTVSSDPLLVGAWIRAVHGSRQFARAFNLISRLHRDGRLRAALTADRRLLATAAWALQSEPHSALTLLDEFEGDDRSAAVRFMITSLSSAHPAQVPLGQEWEEAQRLLSWGYLLQGRLGDLARLIPGDDHAPLLNPNVVLAAAFRQDKELALSLWQRVPSEIRERPHSRYIEALLHITCGQDSDSLPLLQRAVKDSRNSGFALAEVYELFASHLASLRGNEGALADLETLLDSLSRSGQAAYVEWAQCFIGIAQLQRGDPSSARLILQESVTAATRAQRRLLVPLAAVAYSEACAQLEDVKAAHEAAELAYHVSQLAGNVSALEWGLRLFPRVKQREVSRDSTDMRWKRLGAPPAARTRLFTDQRAREGRVLLLQPFGRDRHLRLDACQLPMKRLKVFELVACLARHPKGIDRFQLQQMLFPEADAQNGGNHFRQITHKLRQATGVSLVRRENLLLAPEGVSLDTVGIECERLIASSSSLTGAARAQRLEDAMGLIVGPYLWDSTLGWVEEQRNHYAVVHEETSLELAHLYVELTEWVAARGICERIIEGNPYADPAYLILMEIERSVGSETSAFAVYKRAEEALGELGLRPGDTRRFLTPRPR